MRTLGLAILTLLLSVASAFAQFETAEVVGTVHDKSGGSITKAVITLTNQDTAIQAKTATDENGNYDFLNVKVGRYKLTVELTGFTTFTATDIAVDVGARRRVDATLQVGAVTETVEVRASAEVLNTDTSEHSQVINTQQVVELPLNGRNYADLALLSTNVHRSPMAALFSPTGTPREAAFNVDGMRSTYNNFLLDGLDNNAYGTSNQSYSSQVVQVSPDALNEFKVITSNFSAEYGRVGGGIVNAAMRTGSNQLHGTAYEFLRNTDLNAVGFFAPTGGQKPTLQRNQFGFTVGGPFIKNKLFFFADYEGYRQLQRYLNFDSLPTMTERAGVLPVAVMNPLNGSLFPAGSTIPASQMTNPIAAAVLAALPATNTNGTSLSNNYEALLLIRDYSDKYDAKLDYQINDKMTMFLRFDQRKDLQYYQPDITGLAGGDGNGYIHAIQQQAAVGYTWTVSPTSLFEARLGFSHVLAGKQPAYLGSPSPIMSGFEGLPTAANVAGGLDSQSITGFSLLGRQATNPQFQNPTDWNPKFNYSHVMGRHTLKAGYEFLMIRTEVLDINPLYGEDFYNGQYSTPGCAGLGMPAGCSLPAVPTGVSSATATTNYNLADFMFGTPSQIALGNNQVTNLRQHVHGMYVQDDWHVNSKLTVNLGLRYEFATPLWERDNLWSNFDPTTNTLVRATSGSLYDRALVNPDHSDWGPRIGLAYSVTPTTVLRGGYGISYDFFNRPGSAEEGINGPLSIFGVINQTSPVGNPSFLTTQNSFTTNIASPASFNPILSNIDYIPANTKWPYVQSWFFSLQHELNKDTVLELGYNGNHSLRLPIIGDYNQANVFVTGGPTGIQQRRPDQSFGAITWVDPAGDNDYNGVSLRLEHRLGGGLYFLNSFTWSKALGDSEQALEYYAGGVEANPQNMYNLGAERGPASFDVKLLNVSSMVYQLPFGHGRQFGSNMNRVADAIVGGWEVNSIITAQTGVPLNVYYSPSTAANLTGLSADYRGEEFLRPNVTGSWVREVTNSMINSYFNGYTFTTPPTTDPFGDAGRDAFRAPGLIQWDFAANKSFRITESKSLQFRSEFFNFTNHTNFGLPNVTSNSSSFGQIRTTYPARQVQFALKFLF
jgi:hypothetical protein